MCLWRRVDQSKFYYVYREGNLAFVAFFCATKKVRKNSIVEISNGARTHLPSLCFIGSRGDSLASTRKEIPRMLDQGRNGRAIARVPRPVLLKTMSAVGALPMVSRFKQARKQARCSRFFFQMSICFKKNTRNFLMRPERPHSGESPWRFRSFGEVSETSVQAWHCDTLPVA